MGSRRSQRAHGRTSKRSMSRASTSISKVKLKKQVKSQQKASRLANARVARKSLHQRAPLLLTLLPVCEIPQSRLELVVDALKKAPREKGSFLSETLSLLRDESSPRATLITALDAAKVADILILVFDGRSDLDVAAVGLIDAIRAQGLPSVYAIAIGADKEDVDLRKLRGRQLAAESLGDEHTLRPIPVALDGSPDAEETNRMAIRRILSKSPREVAWRSRYGYMYAEDAQSGPPPGCPSSPDTFTLKGWIRGRGLSANELLHITGVGSFAVKRILDASTGAFLSQRNESDAEPVESEAEIDETMGEQTWPPEMGDGHLDHNNDVANALAEEFDAAADVDSDEEKDDGVKEMDHEDETLGTGHSHEEDDADDMSVDEDEVRRTRAAAQTDLEFPDEVDTPMEQPARVRFARYRGLKSLRTGEWDPKEQLPREYASIFQFRNLQATRKRTLIAAAMDSATKETSDQKNFARSGTLVYIEVMNMSQTEQEKVYHMVKNRRAPVVACGLLRHENRRSVVHFAVKRLESVPEEAVIKAKTPLELHCGFVRFTGKPMFSEHNANSDKHKMERYLVPERPIVVTFYGPAIFTPAPALLSYINGDLIAAGSALGADPYRIILKRIILTGYPFKTQKRRAVVKFMFFNPEDVRWFKPVELWTKLGRTGNILEPLGTHGLMKCIFDSSVLHHDTVCMTLYKRVYPKLIKSES